MSISVLLLLRDMLFHFNQDTSLHRSTFGCIFSCFRELFLISRFVSSAKCLVVQSLVVECRSLMNIKNNIGPKTEP